MNCQLNQNQLDRLAVDLETVENCCESPIERLFGTALAAEIARTNLNLRIEPQRRVGRYRYDFAILLPDGTILMLIECDGKAFHSTAEQQDNDRRKDTAARIIGAVMARYTGAEITVDARYCAENAIGRLCKAWQIKPWERS